MKRAADVEAKAAAWIQRREAPDWDEADEQSLALWVAEDRAHHIAMLRLSSVWVKADRLRVNAPKASLSEWPAPSGQQDEQVEQVEQVEQAGQPQQVVQAELFLASASACQDAKQVEPAQGKGRVKPWRWPAALAASVALLAMPLYSSLFPEEAYSTPVGGFQHVPLADGSLIDLNTNSRLTVDYNQSDRRIHLSRGEAYFKVAKNVKRPFFVETSDWRVTAVGTAFTVHAEDGVLDVIVTEGRIRIDPVGAAVGRMVPVYASAGQSVRLASKISGAKGGVAGDGGQAMPAAVTALDDRDVETALGWRDGLLTFEARPLAEVAAELNRYNHVQMSVDPSAANIRVDGSFRTTNAAGFIRLVEEGFGVRAIRSDGKVILTEKK